MRFIKEVSPVEESANEIINAVAIFIDHIICIMDKYDKNLLNEDLKNIINKLK